MASTKDQKYWAEEKAAFESLNAFEKRRAKFLTRIINGITALVGLSFALYPIVYHAQLIFLLLIPWVVLPILKNKHHSIKAFEFKKSPYSNFGLTFFFAYWPIITRSAIDYTVIDYTNAWYSAILFTPLVLWLFLGFIKSEISFSQETRTSKLVLSICMLLAIAPYTFYTTIAINCSFDYTSGMYVESSVVGKSSHRVRYGGRNYYSSVELPPNIGTTQSIKMSQSEWDGLYVGQKIELNIREGLLGISWLEVYQKSNNFTLHILVADSLSQSPLSNGTAVINQMSFVDTVKTISDSISFQLDYDRAYSVKFEADGYQTKTILFNTEGVPSEDKENGFVLYGARVNLIPRKGRFKNDTVAKCWFNSDSAHFVFEKIH